MKRTAVLKALAAIGVAAAISQAATFWPERFKVIEDVFPGSDKGGHFLVMGLLAAFLIWTLTGTTWGRRKLTAAACLLGSLVLVTFEEVTQLLIPGRTFSWLDLAYSWAGVLTFGTLAAWLLRWRSAKPVRPRTLLVVGIVALVPPALYAAATTHGRPFMLGSLLGPDSNHTTSGLVILALALIFCPLVAFSAGWKLWRPRWRPAALGLMLVAMALLVAALTIQQPYHAQWSLGPGAESTSQSH